MQENPNTVIVESGNIINDAQKLDVLSLIYAKLKYDAIGIGEQDLMLGDAYFKKVKDEGLPVLDATPNANECTKPYIIKNVDGVKVGIVSFGTYKEGTQISDYEFRKSQYAAYKAARDGSDVLILLDNGNTINKEWIERNGARFGAPDIVIGNYMKQGLVEPEVVGRTHIMPTGYQGKVLCVADLEIVPGQDIKVTVQKLTVEQAIEEDPEIKTLVDEYEKAHGVLPDQPGHPVTTHKEFTPPVTKNTKPYYPSQLCKVCHMKQFDDWQKTKHATAVATLISKERVTPECLPCHSEMYRTLGQFVPQDDNKGGIECATCHYDALPHGMDRAKVAVKTKVNPQICVECHTKDRSPDYDEKTYMQKVSHINIREAKAPSQPENN